MSESFMLYLITVLGFRLLFSGVVGHVSESVQLDFPALHPGANLQLKTRSILVAVLSVGCLIQKVSEFCLFALGRRAPRYSAVLF